jgi:hypothetical protein
VIWKWFVAGRDKTFSWLCTNWLLDEKRAFADPYRSGALATAST